MHMARMTAVDAQTLDVFCIYERTRQNAFSGDGSSGTQCQTPTQQNARKAYNDVIVVEERIRS